LNDWLFQREKRYIKALKVPELPEVNLGDLIIVADTYRGGILFLERSGVTLISVFLKSLVLSAILFVMFHTLLTKPLLKVIDASRAVDPERPEKTRLPVPAGHEGDEIGDLVMATNKHLSLIDVNLEKLREAEGQLKGYSEVLEQQVEQRTLELSEKNKALLESNKALVIAKEQAVTKAKSRADFLSSMSHEIRTPFNGVLGMISLTLEEPLSEKQKDQLTIAHSSGKALLNLLNDILDISKVESGKLELESIPFDLREIVENTVRLLAPTAHAKNVTVYTSIDPALSERFRGDPTRVRQIISNLVGNAIKFTEQGWIDVRAQQISGGKIHIEIEDTGIGIETTQLETIFRPFAQANADITRRFGGTGLGLTLCHQLITKMQGSIRIESQPDKGSCFNVTLPLPAIESSPAPEVPHTLQQAHAVLFYQHDNRTCSQLARQLKHWGVDCITNTYSSIDEIRFDPTGFSNNCLILVDSRALAAGLRELPQDLSLVVVLVANQPDVADTQLFRQQQIAQLIVAPVSRQRLVDGLYRALTPCSKPEQPAEPASTNRSLESDKGRLLLVEDNHVNQMVATAMLKKLGYNVMVVSNGKEALEAVLGSEFELILMDCHMPIMDGFEAAAAIRSYPQFDRIPIIALTANVMQGDKEKCLFAGMNDYMSKPYDRVTLLRMLERWCRPPHPDSDVV
jgi:signal transduction histidine kinase/CheY-like chemotaxis protein